MCGIAGAFSPAGALDVSHLESVRAMLKVQRHRGPDEAGIYTKMPDAVLGHRRLSIIDLKTGQQPMRFSQGRYWITYNGEIYNFKSVKQELESKGQRFKTNSDTEVILGAYAEWREACVEKLEGMFAFAIYDNLNNQLFLARDHIGKKPLYYYWNDNIFLFASELSALASIKKGLETNRDALAFFLNIGFIPAPFSIYSNISKLCPGQSCSISARGLRLSKYYTPAIHLSDTVSYSERLDSIESLIESQAVARLMSEVPLGAFLSGGVDSSLVVGLLSRHVKGINTVSIGFKGEPGELETARKTSEIYGTNHDEFIVKPDYLSLLPQMAFHFGEPFSDSSCFPTWEVSRAMRQKVTVALSGDGGDEPFGGYDFRYLPHMRDSRIRNLLPNQLLPLLRTLSQIQWLGNVSSLIQRGQNFLKNLTISDGHAYFRDLCIGNQDLIHRLTPDISESHKFVSDWTDQLYASSGSDDPLQSIMLADVKLYMCEDVLVKVDRMSMAHSLEVRSPLLSKQVIDKAFTLPSNLKIGKNRSKKMLRDLLLRILPKSIAELPKRGFHIPLDEWLRTDWKQAYEDNVINAEWDSGIVDKKFLERLWRQHLTGRFNHGSILMNMMFLSAWQHLKLEMPEHPDCPIQEYND